ncbi:MULTISPECIES: DUF952 domain-containing protein [Spirosoma]|uniref:DUF952 domain-containing protein n=1 Tax=Spirosoma sordidisoli TaxID=2502893 RepID=A0A4Q2UES4_9BACT|nr:MULTISPECIES: DUF952 domain-containing protein [Spirosoma]RYC67677.1 DUF952 domain-containing protein [Spirosoma sordidisoli]
MIYHVVTAMDWTRQQDAPVYEAASLQTEGFIHLSTREQVAGVLERYYQNVPDLLLLQVDESRLTHELKYEAATNNELFPHLYGPLNKEAIVSIDSVNNNGVAA